MLLTRNQAVRIPTSLRPKKSLPNEPLYSSTFMAVFAHGQNMECSDTVFHHLCEETAKQAATRTFKHVCKRHN